MSSEHDLFRKTVRDFVNAEIRPHAEAWEEAGYTPKSLWKRCGEMGFLGINYSEAYGGMGLDYHYTAILAEELSACGSPGVAMGLLVQSSMATPALAERGSEYLKKTYLAPAIRGEIVMSIAVTEPGAGSDVAGLSTRAVLDGEVYVLNGRKMFITNGSQANVVVVLARTEKDGPPHRQFSLLVVPKGTPGFSAGKPLKKTCYPSSDTAELIFDNVRVPQKNRIGEAGKGFMYQMAQFQVERLVAVCMSLGMMKRAYALTKRYIGEREIFGKRLSGYQVTQHKMVQMASEIFVFEQAVKACVAQANQGGDFTREVSMIKLIGAQLVQRVAEECVQLHGGYGLMSEYEVARYFRDAKLMGIGGGSNEVMKEIISKMEKYE